MFFSSDEKLRSFRVAKNKALVNAFPYMSPTLWASVETSAFRKDVAKILHFFENIGGVQQKKLIQSYFPFYENVIV